MASLSLPRVLQTRKTSLEVEREHFEKSQATAINKAINSSETPVKQKHVRSAIIGTFQQQGAQTFWSVVLRLPAMDDRIVAWKLCHVLHKVLREGHPLCLVHSQRHVRDLDEIGKLWGHLKEGYGRMIRLYTFLLMTKLDFHKKNPRFPGHLGVTREELDSIGGNDINNYFQISVEMFDYLDSILDLQAAIFGSLDMSRSNSMTSAGQCRLAPLIPCIQDASKLYDYCVKILFRLHSALPSDTLAGHRERFLKQFKGLKMFYQNTNALQYFKDLITVPPLPESPPNFLIQANLHNYVTQEVVVPQDEEEPVEGSLIDTSDSVDHTDSHSADSGSSSIPTQSHIELIAERDRLIQHLQMEVERLRVEINKLAHKSQRSRDKLHDQIVSLETELATKESELVQERQVKEDLISQSFAVAQNQDAEQLKKFNQLKEFYVKLRGEHITLLRQKGEMEKELKSNKQALHKVDETRIELEGKIREMEVESSRTQERVQQASSSRNEELENLKRDKELFHMEREVLKKSVEDAYKEREEISRELKANAQLNADLDKRIQEMTRTISEMEQKLHTTKITSTNEISNLVSSAIQESKIILQHAILEVDNPALSGLSCNSDYLNSLTKGCREALESLSTVSHNEHAQLVVAAARLSHRHSVFLIQGRATSNASPDIMFGEKMAEACKQLGESVLCILDNLRNKTEDKTAVTDALKKLQMVSDLAQTISGSLRGETAETLADMLDGEMLAMDKAIEEAANRIQEMLNKSRAADSGIKLEVNEKILDSCTTLMQAIRVLVQKARLLQGEIVAQGRGTASAKEFYKRNHQWTDGFISAAKAVGVAAKFLLSAADKVVLSQGKLEQLVVAAQEIAASTAQLVVASRVKADRKSNNLQQLTHASKGVTTATGCVVATVKDCSQLIDEVEELDTSNMTLNQAKRWEMESQVRVLELEKELEQERLRLSALRRHHYQLADDG